MKNFQIFTGELYTDIIPYRVQMVYNEQRRLDLFEMFWIILVQSKGDNPEYLQQTLETMVERAKLEKNMAYNTLDKLVNQLQYLATGGQELSLQLRVADLEFSEIGMEYVGKTPEQLQVLPQHAKNTAAIPEPNGIEIYYNSITQQASTANYAYKELPRHVTEPRMNGIRNYPVLTTKLQSLYLAHDSGIVGSINAQAFTSELLKQIVTQYLEHNQHLHPWYNDKVELLGEPTWEQQGKKFYQKIDYYLEYEPSTRKLSLGFNGSQQEIRTYQQWLSQNKFESWNLWYHLVLTQVGDARGPLISEQLAWDRVQLIQPVAIATTEPAIRLHPSADFTQWRLTDRSYPQLELNFTLKPELLATLTNSLTNSRSRDCQAVWYFDSTKNQFMVRSVGRLARVSFYNQRDVEIDLRVIARVPELTGEVIFEAVRTQLYSQLQQALQQNQPDNVPNLVKNYLAQLRYLVLHFITPAQLLGELTELHEKYQLPLAIDVIHKYIQQLPLQLRQQLRSPVWEKLLPRPTSYAELELFATLLPAQTQLGSEYLEIPEVPQELFAALLTNKPRAFQLVSYISEHRFRALAQMVSQLHMINHVRELARDSQVSLSESLKVTRLSGYHLVQFRALQEFIRNYFPEYFDELSAGNYPLLRIAQYLNNARVAPRWQQAERIALLTFDYLVTRGGRDLLTLQRKFHKIIVVDQVRKRFTQELRKVEQKRAVDDYANAQDLQYVKNIFNTQDLLTSPGLLFDIGSLQNNLEILRSELGYTLRTYQEQINNNYPKIKLLPSMIGEYENIVSCAQYFKTNQVWVFSLDEEESADQILNSYLSHPNWRDDQIRVVHDIPESLEDLDSDVHNATPRIIPELTIDPYQVFNLGRLHLPTNTMMPQRETLIVDRNLESSTVSAQSAANLVLREPLTRLDAFTAEINSFNVLNLRDESVQDSSYKNVIKDESLAIHRRRAEYHVNEGKQYIKDLKPHWNKWVKVLRPRIEITANINSEDSNYIRHLKEFSNHIKRRFNLE